MKAGFISLGCSKNLVDTENMLGILKEHGIEITNDPAEADILIVNTCAFIQSAKEESITTILNMAEYKESGRCRSLIVAGCLGQRYKQELLDDMPEADAIIGTGSWSRIMEAVEETLKGNRVVITGDDQVLYDEHTPRIRTTPGYTAYVKIAEGCDNRCAFCAIPMIRGRFRSRTIDDIRDEVENLTEQGVKEVILIAQDSTNYGLDLYGNPALADLLRELCKIEKLKWIRTLYCYPKFFTDELIDVYAKEPKICKYVDLPLQHAHDSVLRSMRRPDTQEQMRVLLKKLRDRIPGVTIRSTFIVGFPGETEEDFAGSLQYIDTLDFSRMHIFPYSPREGTPAAARKDQVPDTVKKERVHRMEELARRKSQEFARSFAGRTMRVLFETESDGLTDGLTDNYIRVYTEDPVTPGEIYDVKIGDLFRDGVRGRIVKTS